MLIETYAMIVPKKCTLNEYEQFYMMYGSIIRNSLLINKLLNEVKDKLPNLYIEMTQNIRKWEKQLPLNFLAMGLKYEQGLRKNYEKSIANSDVDEIKKCFNNNIELYIYYLTNKQQFLNLYTAFEDTMHSYLSNRYNSKSRKKDLISTILENINSFLDNFSKTSNYSFTCEQLKKIWSYYTNLRNLYSHSGGYISQTFLDKINGVKAEMTDFLEKDESMYLQKSLFLKENTDLFQFDFCRAENKGKLFTISEYNLRFFRNLIVNIWETIYINTFPNIKVAKNFKIEKNIYTFRFVSGNKETEALQNKEQNITENNPCFNISGYICPKCEKLAIILYKAKFEPPIDISELILKKQDFKYKARNVFACPSCRSFFFPKYQENLNQNNGFNILDLNEIDYEYLLNLFESKADINYGWKVTDGGNI